MKKTFVALFLLLILASCQMKGEPKNFLTIHRISEVAVKSPIYQKISLVDGRQVQIAKIPMISNVHFLDAEPFRQRDGKYGLRIALDSFGKRLWRQESSLQAGSKVVLVSDNKFQSFCNFEPFFDHLSEKSDFILYSDLSYSKAAELSKTVQHNYDLMND